MGRAILVGIEDPFIYEPGNIMSLGMYEVIGAMPELCFHLVKVNFSLGVAGTITEVKAVYINEIITEFRCEMVESSVFSIKNANSRQKAQ